MNHVRIHGDPFADSREASALRSFLRTAAGAGMRASLCLSAVRERPVGPGERAIPLTDGVRNWTVASRVPHEEVEIVLQAAAEQVSATAPVVVFVPEGGDDDAVRMAELEWPRAAAVVAARPSVTPAELVQRVRAELRWAGAERQPHALPAAELRRWFALPAGGERTTLVHVVTDPFADGTDLVVDVFARRPDDGLRLLLVMPGASAVTAQQLRERAGESAHRIDVVFEGFRPEHVADAAAIVMPCR
ncbi:MAG TPA: hypothetical protein ENI87_09125, partial [bacterium]|nr:hypothetical protein [bacterium]